MSTFKIDPEFRALIPPLADEEKAQLEKNIIKHGGAHDPFIVWNGLLLDGHNRAEICNRLSLPYATTPAKGIANRDDAKLWILNHQLGRRNLQPFQRAELAIKIEPLIAAKAKEKQREHGGTAPGQKTLVPKSAQVSMVHEESKTRVQVAKSAGIGHDTYRKAKVIAEKAPEEVKARLRSGEETINHAYSNIHRAERRAQAVDSVGKADPLVGKYRVFYADPPWKYGDAGYGNGPAEFHYPTMTIPELCALPVKGLALDDAVLFLWVTSPLLEDAFPVINAWGFKYKSSFVWNKVKHNVGHYNSVRHEFLLIATRGSCTPDDRRLVESVQAIERGEHSVKPEKFREIIEQMYPNGARLELFARRKVEGWTVWGNQA